MSAITSDIPEVLPQPTPTRATLRSVSVKRAPRRIVPFGVVVLLLLGISMGIALMISTLIQAQSAELTELEQRAAALSYQEAALEAEVQRLESPQHLTQSAWDLGMRPNPNAPFLEVPGGHIVGSQEPVAGDEVDGLAPRGGR